MSVESVELRIAQIQSLLAPAQAAAPAAAPTTTSPSSFSDTLAQATNGAPTATAASMAAPLPAGGSGAGSAVVAAAQGEIGQAEFPPGSNDSPRIAQYRQAVAGSGVGPWCAYFASWACRQAGVALGDQGQGFGYVGDIANWASRTGRLMPNTATPQPGDLILFGTHHVGIVEGVLPDGRIQTIEGNSSDQVARRQHSPSEATGFVRVG